MDIGQLCSILAACISQEPQQRKAAEATLAQFQHVKGQLVNLLRVAVEDSLDVGLRQVAAISFKNLVRKDWDPPGSPSPIPEEDKAAVRDNLLEGIVRAPQVVRTQLGECLKAIVHVDFPESWPGLLPIVLQNLGSQEQQRLYGALFALRILTRKYEFKDEEDRIPLGTLVDATFPILLRIFQGLLASESASLEVAELLKLVCKVFWSTTYMGIPPLLLQEAQFTGWLTCLLQAVQRPVPQEGQPADSAARKAWPWWKAKKWALHIAQRLFARYGDPKHAKEASPERAFAQLWKQHCSAQFLDAHLALLAAFPQGQYITPRVINLALQYLTTAVGLSSTWKPLKAHMGSLLASVVFPLCSFNDEDEELWQDDPQEYIRKGYDVMEEMYNEKTAAMNFVHELCKTRTKGNLETFMGLCVNVMNEYQSPTKEQCRRMDGAFLAVGALSDVLKKEAPYKAQLEPMLLRYVVPAFGAPVGHLRAKACWVTQQYADMRFAGGRGRGATFLQLFQSTLGLLADPELPVRVDAVAALRSLVDAFHEDDLPSIKPLIPSLLNQLFALMAEVESEDVVFTLETIVEKFGEEMAPFAVGLCQHLSQAFWRLQEAADEEDDEGEGLMASYGCMRALSTVLDSVSSMPALFPQLEDILFPVMQRLSSTEGQDVFEEVMEIVSYFTYFSPSISERMWTLWPQLVQCFHEWAIDYFENLLVPLDNFISRGTDTFLSGQNPNYLQQVNHLVETALTNADLNESDIGSAPRLLEIIMQNCRGRVDGCIGHYIALALNKLPTAGRSLLKDQLVNVVATALYYNPSLALQQLQAQGRTQAFFSTWFQMIFATRRNDGAKHFRRLYDKKVNALGMASVLSVPDESLPADVAAGLPQLMGGLDMALDADDEEDELDEDGDSSGGSESDEEGDEDDENGHLDEDDDVDEGDEDEYIKRLARESARMRGRRHEESDSDDEWTDNEEDSAPLDDVDPFVFFADSLRSVQSQMPARFQGLMANVDANAQLALQGMMHYAEEMRAKPPRED
ncbi:ARM repeat-containing protein [Coccomyxa subellipsoidea C-169]|uniref:ARM repeat-containing protein n=1 Tax=Coccomyxa subellipsoidea (strain C-169) TaxID=574566 RepID=I0YZB8_COCSC|nr:ARM repeat-containing protein [Coccomyxa subellipsoidea C-169]EIE23737.1 ARM repeat-containing protein [Coccomyxa subellipsoidea C-169]|eukprot:XP_005648281.1 ARM repeat-containing protein [Coccomyxa subellipsoidea C-169]